MENQNNRWQYVENHIAEQNQKMIKLESQLSDIAHIKREMSSACTNILGIQTEMKTIKTKMSDYDNTIQQYSDICDDLTTNNSEVDIRVDLMMNRLHTLQDKQQDINQKQQETCEKLTDIQWRSMRDNLIFSGIPEERQFREKGENCEEVIQNLISTELQIPDQISIDCAHRLGRFNPRHAYPHPIVAKSTYFKDKERVRKAAPKKLRDTNIWVKEQYPQEIELKRKQLYEPAKRVRQDPNNKVRLVRDKLFINNRQYMPNETPSQVTSEYPRVVVIITSKVNKEIIRRGRETQAIQARELMQQPVTDSNCCKLYQQVTLRVCRQRTKRKRHPHSIKLTET